MSLVTKGQKILAPVFCRIMRQSLSPMMGMPRISMLFQREYCSTWLLLVRRMSLVLFLEVFSSRNCVFLLQDFFLPSPELVKHRVHMYIFSTSLATALLTSLLIASISRSFQLSVSMSNPVSSNSNSILSSVLLGMFNRQP